METLGIYVVCVWGGGAGGSRVQKCDKEAGNVCKAWRRKWQPAPVVLEYWREEPGGLQFMGLQGVGRDLASAALSRSVVSDSV